MTIAGKSILAVVPARGGSKGIPGKNLRTVGGTSLVGRAARFARALPWVDAALISTDDEMIAEEARRHGLDDFFRRPPELAGDYATSVAMWQHAWRAAECHYGRIFDVSILLEPTSPLRISHDAERTVRAVAVDGHAAAATISRTPAHFTPQKTLLVADDGRIRFYVADGTQFSNRHLIPAYYHRNGLCYAVERTHLLEHGQIIDRSCQAIIVDRPVVNIDDVHDLHFAEWLFRSGDSASADTASTD
ncbi:MAG: acylneuraminate cytidylyltransferase family protein [Alphaproteobacteria bacterium]|nr:acylneuraminate cytidylyltransferase family protein [Alphaproteobacteria bacterium]